MARSLFQRLHFCGTNKTIPGVRISYLVEKGRNTTLAMPRTLAVTGQWQPEWKRGLVCYHHWISKSSGPRALLPTPTRQSKPPCRRTVLSKKQRKLSRQRHQDILDAKQKLIFFTVAAPEKINFDTELPLYKQITILSNNLICAKPTENSLKNQ